MIPDPAGHDDTQTVAEIRPPFWMEETTHAPVHKTGCEICKAYLRHIAEASRNLSLESYFIQKEADHQRRIKADVDAAYHRGRKDANPSDGADAEDLGERCKKAEQELAAAVEEVARLNLELSDLEVQIAQAPGELNRCGSEIYGTALAATGWQTDYAEGLRLYINRNNTLVELSPVGLAESAGDIDPHWDQTFAFPGEILPNSAIAVANSFVSKSLIPDLKPSCENDTSYHGRGVIRVFYFDTAGVLREWVYADNLGWRNSDLKVADIDPTKLATLAWAAHGRACWSLIYSRKSSGSQGSLCEIRCTGGSTDDWSKGEGPVELHNESGSGQKRATVFVFERTQETPPDETTRTPIAGLSSTTTLDGGRREVFFHSPPDGRPQNAYPIQHIWRDSQDPCWYTMDKYGSFPYAISTNKSVPTSVPSYASLHLPGVGVRIWIQHGSSIHQWQKTQDNTWHHGQVGSNNSSPNAPVTVASKGEKVYLFSVFEGKVVQTTYDPVKKWSSRPIIVRRA